MPRSLQVIWSLFLSRCVDIDCEHIDVEELVDERLAVGQIVHMAELFLRLVKDARDGLEFQVLRRYWNYSLDAVEHIK